MQDGEKAAKAAIKCNICNKSFSSSAYQQHLTSKRHLARAAHKASRGPTRAPSEASTTSIDGTQADDEKKMKIEDKDEDEGDEFDNDEFEERMLPVGTCYFCNKNCKTVKK